MEARRSQKRPLGITALVGLACGVAAMGCLRGRRWGYRLAVGLFVVNLIGDVANATLRGELRALLGIPVVIGLLWYITRPSVRAYFATTP